MADVAQLGIVVTQTGLKDSVKDLDNLAKSADKAEKAVDKLNKTSGSAPSNPIKGVSKELEKDAEAAEQAAQRKVRAAKQGAEGVRQVFTGEAAFLQSETIKLATFGKQFGDKASLTAQIKNYTAGTQHLVQDMGDARQRLKDYADHMRKLRQEANQTQGSLKTFFNTVERRIAGGGSINVGSTMQQAKQLGVTGAGLKELEQRIRDSNSAFLAGSQHSGRFAKALEDLGLKTARARTEMIVLGHEAVTGNWKRFGGSLMVLGEQANIAQVAIGLLTNPIVLATAGLIGMTAAIIHAESETRAFNLAVNLTGNFAGATEESVTRLAASLSSTEEVTKSTAREIEVGLIRSGRVGKDAFEMATKATVDYMNITGETAEKSTENTIKMFEHPAKFASELTQQYGLLNAKQIEHIEMLERTGQSQQAATELLKSYTEYMAGPASQNVSSLTVVTNTLKDAAYGIADGFAHAAIGIGSFIKNSEAFKNLKGSFMGVIDWADNSKPPAPYAGAPNTTQQQEAQRKRDAAERQAKIKAFHLRFRTKEERVQEDRDNLRGTFFENANSDKIAPSLYTGQGALYKSEAHARAAYERENQNIQDKIIKPKKPKAPPPQNTRLTSQAEGMLEGIEKSDIDKLASAQKQFLGYVQQTTLAKQQSLETDLLEINLDKQIKGLKDQLQNTKGLTEEDRDSIKETLKELSSKKYLDNLRAMQSVTHIMAEEENEIAEKKKLGLEPLKLQIQAQDQLLEKQLQMGDISQREMNQQKDMNDLKATELEYEIKIQAAKNALLKVQAEKQSSVRDTTVVGLQREIEQLQQELELAKAGQKQKTSYEGPNDGSLDGWKNSAFTGAKKAYQGFKDDALNTTKGFESVFNNAFSGMTDAIVNFTQTGKLSFKDFARSLIVEVEKMIVKMLILEAIQAAMGMMGGGNVGGYSANMGGMTMNDVGSSISSGLTQSAQGNAFDSGSVVKRFANGGAFTNSIADRATTVPMAQFGENGPEAVMPLTRDATGKLGVATSGGGSNSAPVINITVNNNGGTETTSSGDDTGKSKELGKHLALMVKNQIVQEMRPGGLLSSSRSS